VRKESCEVIVSWEVVVLLLDNLKMRSWKIVAGIFGLAEKWKV